MTSRNSLERMLSVLSLFTEDRLEWTPEEMIERLGYARPTLYRYLKTLSEAGLLSSQPPARYTVGPKVVELDYLVRMSDPLILAGAGVVERLTRQFTSTGLLLRWYRDRILCVHSQCSMKPPRSSYQRGRPMELDRGSIPRSIIAHLPKRKAQPLIEQHLEDYRSIGFGSTMEEVAAGMRKIRRDGYAVARGEVTPGLIGTAAAIFGQGTTPIGSFCLTVSAADYSEKELNDVALAVRDAAAEISAVLRSATE